MFRIRGNIKIPIYLSISLILWIGTFLPTQSFVWAQNPFESNLFEKAYPEINLGPMEHNDVDSVKSKLLKGDTANGFKENDNHLMVSAVGTAPISPNSDLGKSVDRNDHTGEIGTSSSPSTTSWEFPGDIQVSGLSNLQVEPDIASSEINDGNLVASAIDYSSGYLLDADYSVVLTAEIPGIREEIWLYLQERPSKAIRVLPQTLKAIL